MIYGYDNLISDFKRLSDQKELSHAYLFFGEPQTGKFLFARSLANYIENNLFEEPKNSLRETLVVEFSTNQEEGNKESLGIESVRELERFLYQTSISSPYRIAIIRDAEWLTDQAQNSLLKVLEEPPLNGLIIAIASNLDVFLPTVSSRFQKVYFPVLSRDRVLDFLNRYGIIDESRIKMVADASYGRIGRALELLEENKDRKKAKEIVAEVLKKNGSKELFIEKLLEAVDKNPQTLNFFFDELILDLNRDSQKNSEALKKVSETVFVLNTLNVNKRLQLRNLILNL